MRFKLTLGSNNPNPVIPINYQYPLSAAIYKIIARADKDYATFLHQSGYGSANSLKKFKHFTFSDISSPFHIKGDRLCLKNNELFLLVSFHLPEASQHFIKGLFLSQNIDIADKRSKAIFKVTSVEALANPFSGKNPEETTTMTFKPMSPIVAGIKNDKGDYDFLLPKDVRYPLAIQYNWQEKLRTLGSNVGDDSLDVAINILGKDPKSRLVWIKAFTPTQTKIRGYMNFEIELTAQRRYIEVLYNSGVGLYNAMGMGCVEYVN